MHYACCRDYRCLHSLLSPHHSLLQGLPYLLQDEPYLIWQSSVLSCIMHAVGIIVARTFFAKLSLCPSCIMHNVGIIIAQSRDYCCPESGLSLPTLFLRSSHLGLRQGLPCLLQDYANLIRSIRSIASRLALRRPGAC